MSIGGVVSNHLFGFLTLTLILPILPSSHPPHPPKALLFNIAEDLLKNMASKPLEEIAAAWGFKDQLEKLRDTITTKLSDAERKQVESEAVRGWLEKSRDVLYDVDDLFDEFSTMVTRKELMKGSKLFYDADDLFNLDNLGLFPRQVTSDRVQIQYLGKLLPELESFFDSILHKLLVLLGYFDMLLRHLIGMVREDCHVPLDRGESTRLDQRAEAVRRRLEPCERSEKSERHRNYQMLIACAFMVMAFQGALYPPGGVWEDDHANDSRAGTSKLSFTSPAIYIVFASANTLWFLSSTMLLGLLQMGLPMKNKLRASTFIVAVCSAVVVSGSWLVVLAEGGYML